MDQEACFSGPKGAEEAEAVRAVVAALMHELECILHEYLSFNWDKAEDIYEANKKLVDSRDLPRLWQSTPSLHVRDSDCLPGGIFSHQNAPVKIFRQAGRSQFVQQCSSLTDLEPNMTSV